MKVLLAMAMLWGCTFVNAQIPKHIKKTRTAQVTIVAQNASGGMKEAQGIIVDNSSTVLSEYDFLKGAVQAAVIDAQGKKWQVKAIAGASAMYNVVKLDVDFSKPKYHPLPISNIPTEKGKSVYIMPISKAEENAPFTTSEVEQVEVFKDSFQYLTLSSAITDRQQGGAVLNEKGELIGLLQTSSTGAAKSYVIDANFIAGLKINSIDARNTDLNAIGIKKSLPENEEAAASFIYLSENDTTLYQEYVQDFIDRYPDNANGYIMKAEYLLKRKDYEAAESIYTEVLQSKLSRKDEILFSLSKNIYQLNLDAGYKVYKDWNMERALSLANEAWSVNPLPYYIYHAADVLFALKQYDQAAEKYLSVCQTNMRSGEAFMHAAYSKQLAGHPTEDVVALMDSAMSCYTKPYPSTAANVILYRASVLAKAERYRDAVLAYNDFERITTQQLTANFYYERGQLEIKCRMFPAALNDMERAIALSPNDPILYAECASLNYRVNQIDDAIHYAQKAIALDSNFADAYRIMGICHEQKGNKAEAKKYLNKALSLGDKVSESLLNKIK